MMFRRNLSGDVSFKSFVPYSLSDMKIDCNDELEALVSETHRSFRKLSSICSSLDKVCVEKLVSMEADFSWRLSAGKSFVNPGFVSISPVVDAVDKDDIQNIAKAIHYAIDNISVLPISGRLLKNIHYLVCGSARYEKKYPGEFRNSPVWIGKAESNLGNALFVPPVYEDMENAFSELENYINYNEDNDILVRAALIHYQFEAIHPFIDANGRVGRILNLLYLYENKEIDLPILLLSVVLNDYDMRYGIQLQKVNESGNVMPWVMFFINCLKDAAELTIDKVNALK